MVGYGDEDDCFVAELTYNYTVRKYTPGNSHIATVISSKRLFTKFAKDWSNDQIDVVSPSGYNFRILYSDSEDVVATGVVLASTNFQKTINFWKHVAKMEITEK